MTFHLQYRRYALPFRRPIRTARGIWDVREGLLVRLESDTGTIGWGEAAPVPGFGGETAAADEAAIRQLGVQIDDESHRQVPRDLPCLRHALGAAFAATKGGHEDLEGGVRPEFLPVAALLPAGKEAPAVAVAKAEIGFRVFKWKVGRDEMAREVGLLEELCSVLPAGAQLRLDANGTWDRRQAERWLNRCADMPVEFVEQPCPAGEGTRDSRPRRQADDLLSGLARDYPTPIALDESVAGDDDVVYWLEQGWPGYFVIKPSLLGDPDATMARLDRAASTVIFSSALETAVGMRSALTIAFGHKVPARGTGDMPPPRVPRAIGFGVQPLFVDPRLDGPGSGPFLRWKEVTAIKPEVPWNVLS